VGVGCDEWAKLGSGATGAASPVGSLVGSLAVAEYRGRLLFGEETIWTK